MTCQQDIRLQRKDDNSGWLRFELDGVTTHKCQRKKKEPSSTNTNNTSSSMTELEHKIDRLSEQIKHLAELLEARNQNE